MVQVRIFVALILIAPLLWGSVFGWTTAFGLLILIPLSLSIPKSWIRGPTTILYLFYAVLLAFATVLVLQLFPSLLSLPPNQIWQQTGELLGAPLPERIAVNISALTWTIGPVLIVALTFWTALAIGSDYRRANLFFNWSVLGTAILVAITLVLFFLDERIITKIIEYRYRSSSHFSHTFINKNVAASLFGAFAILSLGMIARELQRIRNRGGHLLSPQMLDRFLPDLLYRIVPYLASFAVFIVALLLTASRGGIMLSASALFLLLILLATRSRGSMKLKAAALTVAIGAAIWLFTNWGDVLVNRIDKQGLESKDRPYVYTATVEMIRDYPLLGVGLGGFPSAFPAYRPPDISTPNVFHRTHNIYLQSASEMGIVFTSLLFTLWGLVGFFLFRGYTSRRHRYIFPAIGLSVWLFVSAHSLVSFPLQILGQAVPALAIIGVCLAQVKHRND